jgi:hypothetical protein
MHMKKAVAAAVATAALSLGAFGAGVANADPFAPMPMRPGHGHDDDWCRPWCDNGRSDFKRGDWNKGPWWANNRHDWWDDRNGPPPWGWGPPPPVHWAGGPLPPTMNYWGYNLNPVWDTGFHQWGVWLFGLWIPIFGVGVA